MANILAQMSVLKRTDPTFCARHILLCGGSPTLLNAALPANYIMQPFFFEKIKVIHPHKKLSLPFM
jgi:hypothetical protein